jgi:hypothetical protein
MHVASVEFKCFKCFSGMLQLFHMDVAKVDRDVAYVAMVVHVCCKHLSQCFIDFFRRMLQVCLSRCYICCKCFIQTHVSSISSVFFCML